MSQKSESRLRPSTARSLPVATPPDGLLSTVNRGSSALRRAHSTSRGSTDVQSTLVDTSQEAWRSSVNEPLA